MAAKRRLREKEETNYATMADRLTDMPRIKRLRGKEETINATTSDRLTDMPESLQLHILSFLETRHAVQTSLILSKSWCSSWTCIPVLNFSSNGFKKLYGFDKFVFKALSLREPVTLDKLKFARRGTCSINILQKVFEYAFSHGVKELEVDITRSRACKGWPIWLHTSSDSLKSLTLSSSYNMGCSFLEPRSGSFKNITSLHLKRVIISDLDPFSGFPALEKLKLVYCPLNTKGYVLNVHALHLSELTVLNYSQYITCIELIKTPKLRNFEFKGINFPRLTTHQDGLRVLDTVVIDYSGFCGQNQEKILFDDLLMLFSALFNARSVTVFSSIVHLLSFFPHELVNKCSPFGDLKCLNVDLRSFYNQKLFGGSCRWLSELLDLLPGVNAYLLQKSRDAKCTIIYPDDDSNAESACSSSHGAPKCIEGRLKRFKSSKQKNKIRLFMWLLIDIEKEFASNKSRREEQASNDLMVKKKRETLEVLKDPKQQKSLLKLNYKMSNGQRKLKIPSKT